MKTPTPTAPKSQPIALGLLMALGAIAAAQPAQATGIPDDITDQPDMPAAPEPQVEPTATMALQPAAPEIQLAAAQETAAPPTGVEFSPRTAKTDQPGVAQTSGIDDKLQELEQQQRQLKQEIEQLRQQLRNQTENSKPNSQNNSQPDTAVATTPEFSVSGGALFLRPSTSASMDFARVDPVVPGRIVGGPLAKVEFGRETAGRFSASYQPAGTAWELAATHTFLKANDSASASRPPNGFLYSTLSNPAGNDRAETAEAKAKLAYNVTDLDVGYRLPVSKDLEVKLLTGLKISNLEQSLTANYGGVSYAPDGGRVRQDNDFNGLGPKLGVELRAKLGGGVSLFGRGGAALLLGNSTTGFQETFGTTEVANLNLRRRTSIPTVDMALGIDWTTALSQSTKLNLSLGYEYQHWFNALNSVRFVDNSNPGLYTENRSDLSLQGFFAKLGVAVSF